MILAKSNPPISLEEHSKYVNYYIRSFAKNYSFDEELASIGGILHDIGKAHPEFQERIRTPKIRSKVFRHELSSLCFLSLFDNKEEIIEMVVAHHKSIKEGYGNKGILDLEELDSTWKEFHIGDWNSWKMDALNILENLNIETKDISYKEAYESLEYAVEYCDRLTDGWSNWRGLLMSADHMASAMHDKWHDFEQKLFTIPDLSFYNKRSKESDPVQFPLSKKDVKNKKRHTLVISPTGSGKTDFLMRRTNGRVFYCLPFQASINAMTTRFRDDLGLDDLQVRMQHSSSKISDKGSSQIGIDLQNFGGAAVKVLTPYQLAGILFCHHGFEALIIDIKGQDVILDEVHVYGENSQSIVLEMVKLLSNLECNIHIGSATIPTSLYENILEVLGGKENTYEVKLEDEELEFYNRHFIVPEYEFQPAFSSMIDRCTNENEKVLLVANTVASAQRWYYLLEQMRPDIKKMLLHSRYRRKDRAELEKRLMDDFEKSKESCILISTQVVEVSIDISFDRMLTEAAPIDSLIQRFGRVNRRIRKGEARGIKSIHILKPEDKTLPYDSQAVHTSFNLLENIGYLKERDTQNLVDSVYSELEVNSIANHILWEDNELMMKKLCNTKESPLIDLLQIDTITCILPEDEEEYIESNFKVRNQLEISLHYSSLFAFGNLRQLEEGNCPYILPHQPMYNPYGVVTNPEKIFI